MIPEVNDLLRDPLFQLNAMLWLAQPLPNGGDLAPVLARQGFSVYALAPPLTVPLDLRLRAQEQGLPVRQSARPDIVFYHEPRQNFAVTECKRSSFGAASDVAEQGRALLIISGPRLAEVLALASNKVEPSQLVYVLPEGECQAQRRTLGVLAGELLQAGITAGGYSTLGFKAKRNTIGIVADHLAAEFFSMTEGFVPFIQLTPDTDPRPLYFIPYEPDLNQNEEEKRRGRTILYERMLSNIIVAIGRAVPPDRIRLDRDQVLNDAMFGFYARWENQPAHKHLRRLCHDFLLKCAKRIDDPFPKTFLEQDPDTWTIDVKNEKHRKDLLNFITTLSADRLELLGEPGQMPLFE